LKNFSDFFNFFLKSRPRIDFVFNFLFTGKEFGESRMGEKVIENTAIADYVWLPLSFDGDMIYIGTMNGELRITNDIKESENYIFKDGVIP